MADRDSRLGGARNLGVPPINRRDRLNDKDLNDLFRVTATGRSSLDLGVSGMRRANFNVELYAFKTPLNRIPRKIRTLDFRQLKARDRNKYLQRIGASAKAGSNSESIQTTVEAGEYLVRVLRRTGNSTYQLSVATTPIVDPTPGPSPSPGPSPGPGPTPTPTPSSIQFSQTSYQVTEGGAATVSLTRSSSTLAASVQVSVAGSGTTASASDYQSGQFPLTVNFAAGETVKSFAVPTIQDALVESTETVTFSLAGVSNATIGPNSTTRLSIVDNPPPDDNAPSRATTTTLSTTPITGSVNNSDTQDYYKVNLTAGDYLFTTGGLQGKANVEIYNSSLAKVATFNSSNFVQEKFIQPISSGGDYYIRFFQKTAGTTANYSLTGVKQTDNTSNLATSPRLVTVGTTATPINNYVVAQGVSSPVDYYQFSVAAGTSGYLTAELRNMFGNLNVALGKVGTPEAEWTVSDGLSLSPPGTYGQGTEALRGKLNEGNYILKVYAPAGQGSTYNLSMTLRDISDQPAVTRDINPGGNSGAKNLVQVGNFAFFAATDSDGRTALWRSDGTLDSTRKIRQFNSISDIAVTGDNTLYFVANDGTTGNELWKVTGGGTVSLVTNLAAGNASTAFSKLVVVGNRVYFTANPNQAGWGLYRTKLVGTGVDNITTQTVGGQTIELFADVISDMTVVDNNLFFVSDAIVDGTPDFDKELWRIANAGTQDNTVEKIDLNLNGSSLPTKLTVVRNDNPATAGVDESVMYLTAERGIGTRQLLKLTNLSGTTDAIASGAVQVSLSGGSLSSSGDIEMKLFTNGTADTADDVLYFTGFGATEGLELMKIANPVTSATASLVKDIAPSGADSDPMELAEFNGRLFFIANDGSGKKLWYTTNELDGNGQPIGARSIDSARLNPTLPGSAAGYSITQNEFAELTVVDNNLFLVASSNSVGKELWRVSFSGNNPIMSLVRDLNLTTDPNTGATASSNPQDLRSIGGSLYFVANDGVSGEEVWSVGPSGSIT